MYSPAFYASVSMETHSSVYLFAPEHCTPFGWSPAEPSQEGCVSVLIALAGKEDKGVIMTQVGFLHS
jgi:hypothetical protein